MNAKQAAPAMAGERYVLIATGLMLAVALLNALDAIIVRFLTQDLHPFVIVFFRSLFGLLAVAPWILRNRSLLRSNYAFMHFLRAGLKLLSLVAFFAAIAAAPLADVTAIAFTTPIFVTVGAWTLLSEKPVPGRIVAVIVGFAGILVILQPGQSAISAALSFAVAGAVLAAGIQLMLKRMSAHDPTDTLVAWNLLLTVPLAALPAWWFWTTPSGPQLVLMALQGAIGAMNMTAITRALSYADASYLAPIDFLRLPVVATLAYLVFGEVADLSTWIGATIIFLSALMATGRVVAPRPRGSGR